MTRSLPIFLTVLAACSNPQEFPPVVTILGIPNEKCCEEDRAVVSAAVNHLRKSIEERGRFKVAEVPRLNCAEFVLVCTVLDWGTRLLDGGGYSTEVGVNVSMTRVSDGQVIFQTVNRGKSMGDEESELLERAARTAIDKVFAEMGPFLR